MSADLLKIAADLDAVLGDAVDDVEFSRLVDAVAASRALAAA
jgi:hypothetical protein